MTKDIHRRPLNRAARKALERIATKATLEHATKNSEEIKKLRDLNEAAWGIIANASGGDWTRESDEWRVAAGKWRDRYHETLK